MQIHSRRSFLKASSTALICGSVLLHDSSLLAAMRLGLPPGLQLFSVRDLLAKDYQGTLQQIASLGYREVEAGNFYNRTAEQVKQAMRNAGLNCVSTHHSYKELHQRLDQVISFNQELGASYIICNTPGMKNAPQPKHGDHKGQRPALTLDDWRWYADQLNQIGGKVNIAGMKFGYHNMAREFHEEDGVVPYIELLRLTDPSKVTMEMDCGWVVVGGGDPVELLRRYPTRFSMLHVKDYKVAPQPGNPPPSLAELGQGVIDYRLIFKQAAKGGYVRHVFVDAENFDMPIMQALKIDADYLRKLDA